MDKPIYVHDIDALSDVMLDAAYDGKVVYAALFYEEAIELMRCILDCIEVDVDAINIASGDLNGYYKEFFVSISPDLILNVEPAWRGDEGGSDSGYLWFDADVLFIDAKADARILIGQDAENCIKVEFVDEEHADQIACEAIDRADIEEFIMNLLRMNE